MPQVSGVVVEVERLRDVFVVDHHVHDHLAVVRAADVLGFRAPAAARCVVSDRHMMRQRRSRPGDQQ
jgi:hypothetical protein